MTNEIYIYVLRDPENNEIRYIGKTNNLKKRMWSHLWGARSKTKWKGKTYKDRWIKTILDKGLKPVAEIIELCNKSEWKDRERYWISHYQNLGARLANTTSGGEGVDAPRTKEWKRRIGESHKGKAYPEDAKRRLSKFNTEKWDNGCGNGHPWTTESTRYTKRKNGGVRRVCKICDRIRRGFKRSFHEPSCKYGHLLEGENLRILIRTRDGSTYEERICRECVRIRNRACKKRARERKLK